MTALVLYGRPQVKLPKYIPPYHSFHLHPLGLDFSLNSKDKDLLIVQF